METGFKVSNHPTTGRIYAPLAPIASLYEIANKKTLKFENDFSYCQTLLIGCTVSQHSITIHMMGTGSTNGDFLEDVGANDLQEIDYPLEKKMKFVLKLLRGL